MVSSLFQALDQEFMPLRIDDQNTTKMILQLFPEIQYYYGDNMQVSLFVNLTAENTNFISMSKNSGIDLGKNGKVTANLQIFASNETTPQTLAAEFTMDLQATANVTVDPKWNLYLNIPFAQIANTVLTVNNCGMIARRYDALLSSVLRSTINNINVQWQKPFNIPSLDPQTLPFLSNMFTNLRVSPFYLDEFMYIGFTYFVDPPPQTYQTLNTITEKVVAQYGEKIHAVFDAFRAYSHKLRHDARVFQKQHPEMHFIN